MRTLYMNRATRDAEFKRLGGTKAGYRKTSIRNQNLHPQYVTDYTRETGVELTREDCGLGNTIYQTFFGALYGIGKDGF